MRIKSSHLVAAGLSVAVAGWLLSGQLDGQGRAEAPDRTPADAAREARLATVRVRASVAQPIAPEIVINARTEPARVVEVRVETNGRVVALGPARGARVAAGEVLLELDRRERDARARWAEAAVRQRLLDYQAATKLSEKGFQADTKVAEAEAALEAARAELEQAQVAIAHTTLRAPFDGRLEERPVEIGDFVEIGGPVARVIELDPLLVAGDVSERDIGRLAVGMAGRARLVTGETVEGRLRYVGSEAAPATRTFAVELEVANPALRLPAGVSAELRIALGAAPAHRVPASVLALDDAGRVGVKAVGDDDRVVFHPALIVRAEGEALWLGGLPERLRLITVGQGFVRAGDMVRAVPEGELGRDPPPAVESGA